MLAEMAPRGAVIGLEPSADVEGLARGASADRLSWRFVEVESLIGALRATKSAWEIERLCRAIVGADRHERVRRTLRRGGRPDDGDGVAVRRDRRVRVRAARYRERKRERNQNVHRTPS